MVEIDPVKRAAIYVEMQQIWDEAAHTVWISYPTSYWVARSGLEPTIQPSGIFIPWKFKSK
jgi:hypothetical protein